MGGLMRVLPVEWVDDCEWEAIEEALDAASKNHALPTGKRKDLEYVADSHSNSRSNPHSTASSFGHCVGRKVQVENACVGWKGIRQSHEKGCFDNSAGDSTRKLSIQVNREFKLGWEFTGKSKHNEPESAHPGCLSEGLSAPEKHKSRNLTWGEDIQKVDDTKDKLSTESITAAHARVEQGELQSIAKQQCRRLPGWAQPGAAKTRFEWNIQPSSCQGSSKCNLPLLQFRGTLMYSKTAAEVDIAAQELLQLIQTRKQLTGSPIPMGLDAEWRPTFRRGEKPRKIALLQLCLDGSKCYLMHIIHSGIPTSLRHLLADSSVIKVGVGIYGDAAKLRKDYQIDSRTLVELGALANNKLIKPSCSFAFGKCWSLASLAQELTGKQVEKVSSIRLGDWEECPLSHQQLMYAATDAFVSVHLYQVLSSFPDIRLEESSNNS